MQDVRDHQTRCDHAVADDGRFAVLCYGPDLQYSQTRAASIEKTTALGDKARVIYGRRQ